MFTKGYQGVQIHLASKNVWYFYNLFNPFFFWPFYPNVFSLFLEWQTYLEPKNFFIYHFRLQGVFKHSENFFFFVSKMDSGKKMWKKPLELVLKRHCLRCKLIWVFEGKNLIFLAQTASDFFVWWKMKKNHVDDYKWTTPFFNSKLILQWVNVPKNPILTYVSHWRWKNENNWGFHQIRKSIKSNTTHVKSRACPPYCFCCCTFNLLI